MGSVRWAQAGTRSRLMLTLFWGEVWGGEGGQPAVVDGAMEAVGSRMKSSKEQHHNPPLCT